MDEKRVFYNRVTIKVFDSDIYWYDFFNDMGETYLIIEKIINHVTKKKI